MSDFWQSVFPAYLGAIGSTAGSVVAAVALIRDIRTRRGLKQVTAPKPEGPIAQLRPQQPDDGASSQPDPHVGGRDMADEMKDDVHGADAGAWGDAGASNGVGTPVPFVVIEEPAMRRSGLRVQRLDRRQFELVNVLEEPIAVLQVLQADDGDDVVVRRDLPAVLQPQEALRLLVERTLASPAVIALDVTYGTEAWSSRRRLYLD